MQQPKIHTYDLPSPPSEEALAAWRQKARKKKVPTLDIGARGCMPGIGEFKITEADGVSYLEWEMVGNVPKRFSFVDLGRDPDLAADRLEVGWLIANLWMLEGRRVRDSIPGPNEAMRESERYLNAEDRWRHWARVPAGHMLF
jgi:hypothetical protein